MSRLSFAFVLSFAIAGSFAVPFLPAYAQVSTRAYAPEELWTLSTADQERVIALEYREQSGGRTIPNDQMRFYTDQVRLSRWTFSQVKNDIARSLGNPGGGRPPIGGPGTDTIRCESEGGRRRSCNTPWQGQSRLLRQLSGTRCTSGATWFSSNGQVTVISGCRGEFGPATNWPGPPGGNTTVLRCESEDGRLRTCGSGILGRAQLQRQLSSTRCLQNVNYGVRSGRLWVDAGCRGEFLVRTGGQSGGGDYTVTCSSSNDRYTTCAWDARRGMPRLIQQLSDSSCREGYSWGYSQRGGLWVNHGCRARFGNR